MILSCVYAFHHYFNYSVNAIKPKGDTQESTQEEKLESQKNEPFLILIITTKTT